MKLCCICKKNPAVVFVSKSDGKQFVNEGYCLSCAINSGITPVTQLAEQFSIDPEELKEMVENMSDMISNGDMHDAFADIFGGGNLMDPNDMDDGAEESEEKIPIKDKKAKNSMKKEQKKKKADQLLKAQKNADYYAKRKRFMELEKSYYRIALSSRTEYIKDLPRKMARLDMALWNYGKNPNANNKKTLDEEIAWAKQEKERVKDYPELIPEAEKLAVYAEKLRIISEQGKYITDAFAKRAWNKMVVKDSKLSITVTNSSKVSLTLRVQYFPPPVPKGAKKKPAPKPKNINLKLADGDIEDNRTWIANFESSVGRSDLYFYYMLYNGFWEHGNKLEAIAPAADLQYWRERDIDKMAYNYFKRALWLTTPEGVANYTKLFGNWKSFKRALKDYQKEFDNL